MDPSPLTSHVTIPGRPIFPDESCTFPDASMAFCDFPVAFPDSIRPILQNPDKSRLAGCALKTPRHDSNPRIQQRFPAFDERLPRRPAPKRAPFWTCAPHATRLSTCNLQSWRRSHSAPRTGRESPRRRRVSPRIGHETPRSAKKSQKTPKIPDTRLLRSRSRADDETSCVIRMLRGVRTSPVTALRSR